MLEKRDCLHISQALIGIYLSMRLSSYSTIRGRNGKQKDVLPMCKKELERKDGGSHKRCDCGGGEMSPL